MVLGATVEEATEFALTIGPTARALRDLGSPEITAVAREKLAVMFKDYERDGTIAPPAGVWLVTARPS